MSGDGDPAVRLFLCGDVMTGRGIDQVLPHPCGPRLFEPYLHSAIQYVELAERASGAVGRALDFAYPWGDGLAVLREQAPAVRMVNLETAVTTRQDAQPGKFIHYRMNPRNLPCLTAAGIDCCGLANNHVLDWGRAGLAETLASLRAAGLRTAGAGNDAQEAGEPAAVALAPAGRLLVFAFATPSSGTPVEWAATASQPGVNVLPRLSVREARRVAELIAAQRRPGDIVVVSVHWGGNWGFEVPAEARAFAHGLVDAGGADIVWGHSSHHVMGVEVRRDKLILYGCGDLINDYEGIGGHEDYRPELSLMYFPEVEAATGRLRGLRMAPMRMRRLRLERANAQDAAWLRDTLRREGRPLGTTVKHGEQGDLALAW